MALKPNVHIGCRSLDQRSRIQRGRIQPVRAARSFVFLTLSVFLMAPMCGRLNAQIVQGEPGVGNSTGALVSSPLVLDPTQFPETDACLSIQDAIPWMMGTGGTGNGVVDARALTGDHLCQFNMFPANATGKLLLGNVVLHVTVKQVQPPKFQVEGTGWPKTGATSTTGNTVIQACHADSVCGTTTFAGPLWCWGAGGNCSTNYMSTPSFGSLTQYMSFDCNGVPGCVGMQAFTVQEGTGCWHCQFLGWGNAGKGLVICSGDVGCQNSSFQDLYFAIGNSATTCTASAVPMIVNSGDGMAGPKFIKGVTVDATNCDVVPTGNAYPNDAIRFSSSEGSLENVLVQGTTVGVRVAGDSKVNSVTITGVQTGTTSSTSNPIQCGSGHSTQTVAILLADANAITNATLLSTGNEQGASPFNPYSYVIEDCKNGNNIQGTAGNNYAVAQYTIAPSTTVYFNTNVPPTIATASPATVLDLNSSSVQQYSCAGASSATLSALNLQPGAEMTFIFLQNGSLPACSIAFPPTMHGATAVSSILHSITTQQFVVSNNGTDLYAVAAASVCISSCGVP